MSAFIQALSGLNVNFFFDRRSVYETLGLGCFVWYVGFSGSIHLFLLSFALMQNETKSQGYLMLDAQAGTLTLLLR